MNNENNSKAYPCDEPETKKSYPCDTDDEAFSYEKPSDHSASVSTSFPSADSDASAAVKKGKGRRGGNAAASVVVHSGKLKFKKEERSFDGERRSGERSEHRYEGRGDRSDHRFSDRRNERSGERQSSDFGDRRTENSGNRSERRFDDRHDNRFGDRRNDRSDDRRSRDFGDRRDRNFDDRRGDRFGDKHGDRRTSGSRRAPSPEAVFSNAYTTAIVKTTEVGAFVAAPDDIRSGAYSGKVSESGLVLLPFAEQIGRPERGTEVKVFFYEDKGGRLAATMRAPIVRDGEIGILTVADVTRIGVFLDNGVPKQVLLPFREQLHTPEVGDEVLVYVYSDKSGRQAATMRIYSHLEKNSPYKEDDRVTGFVYEVNPDLGIFVAVDNKYYGLVPIRETFKEYAYGDEIEARVAKVREDGKLDLLIRDKLYKTVQEDADVILYELKRNNGFLPYGDRADAAFIEETYAMSKNQFKRALGHLYKNHIVELDRNADTVRLLK